MAHQAVSLTGHRACDGGDERSCDVLDIRLLNRRKNEGGDMFGLGLPEVIIVLIVIAVPVAIILAVVSRNKRRREGAAPLGEGLSFPDRYVYARDPSWPTKFVKTMLWVYMAIIVVSIVSDFFQLDLLSQSFSHVEAQANDTRQKTIGAVHLVIFIITGIAFLRWIYRVNANSHAFGARGMEFSSGWSVGYYFIPILNLYKPYQAMKEIWRVSGNPRGWQNEQASSLLSWWWALWIISNMLGQISFRVSSAARDVSSLREATVVSVVSDLVGIPLCIVGMLLVSALYLRQKRLVEMAPQEIAAQPEVAVTEPSIGVPHPTCPGCGAMYDPRTYSTDAPVWACPQCHGELPKVV
jgi:hypothetical protein